MAKTKPYTPAHDGDDRDYQSGDDRKSPKQEPCCADPHCPNRHPKRAPPSPTSPEEARRRVSYDAAAVFRSDATRAMRSARLAVAEALRSLEHAATPAEKALDAEVDASNETRGSLSKRRHQGEPANHRFQGDGGGF